MIVDATGIGSTLPALPSPGAVDVPPPSNDGRTRLRDGWRLQSSSKVKDAGAVISTAGYRDSDWYAARVPGTVLAALVDAGVYTEPYKSDTLRRIPAAEFARAWWNRCEFELPRAPSAQRVFLGFDGINYRANVWLNGKLLAAEKDLRGTFRTYRFDVTALVERSGKNALAVEVFRPAANDLAINWWDWVYSPPDLNMGLYQDVYLRQTGPVVLQDLRLTTKVTSVARANVTVSAIVYNPSDEPQRAMLAVRLDDRAARREVALAARESKTVVFEPATTRELAIDRPRLWWPAGLGRPELQTLAGKVSVGDSLSDQRTVRVGLREITSSTVAGARLFSVNGQRVFLRGGGWASDLLLRWDSARTKTELAYALHLGLNMVRLEGKLESDDFYDQADEAGIVLLPGWMCCDVWEKHRTWSEAHRSIARESMQSQAARLRNHPSVAAFFIGSDKAPPPDVASSYAAALTSVDWPNPIVAAASAEGESGLKMTGPYDWVAPNYWLEDKANGGAFGFNSETGPGPAIPELEVMRSFMSQRELDDLWKNPNAAQFHAGAPGREFHFQTLRIFQNALRARLGPPASLEDWVKKAQLMNYEAERAQFEAFGVRKYTRATGVVHWLLNNPWPSLIWHLYDSSLLPAASFYGAKKANEPLHAVFAYDDRSVIVINNTLQAQPGLSVVARVFDLDGVERSSQTFAISVEPDASARTGTITEPAGIAGAHFVELELRRGAEVVSVNTYWLPARKDQHDFAASTWLYTPTVKFADLTGITKLAPATLKISMTRSTVGHDAKAIVTLENTGKTPAFFLRLTLRKSAGGDAVVPVFWDDNYVTLRPGARRALSVACPMGALEGGEPVVEIEGINTAVARVSVDRAATSR